MHVVSRNIIVINDNDTAAILYSSSLPIRSVHRQGGYSVQTMTLKYWMQKLTLPGVRARARITALHRAGLEPQLSCPPLSRDNYTEHMCSVFGDRPQEMQAESPLS